MIRRPMNGIIAFMILWNLNITQSASELAQPQEHSPTLNLLLEMLVKSNQDLADGLDRLQETVTTHASAIDELRQQQSSVQTICGNDVKSRMENKHCDVRVSEILENQIKGINDKVSRIEENQALCEGMNKAIETVDRVKEHLTVLSKGMSSFKVKQLSDVQLFNNKFENMENGISGMQQSNVEIKSSLSEMADDLEKRLDETAMESSDLQSIMNQTDTRHTQEIASIIREQTKHMNQLVEVQGKVDSTVIDISELNKRISNVEERYKTIKDEVKLDIQSDDRKEMVAFSARVSPSYTAIQPGTTIIFSNVEVNIGQGYNPKNGEFSAPASGVFVFYSNILTAANKSIETRLVINGKIKLWLYSGGSQYLGSGSNLLVTHLEKGDIVKMMKYGPWGTKPFYIHHFWSTFSGFLLVPDV